VDSLSATALRLGQSLIVSDITCGDCRDTELEAFGLRSALVAPLASTTYSYGALAVYHDAPRSFDSDQVTLAESLASLVTSALARCRAETVATEQRQLQQAISQSMDSILVVLAGDGNILSTNHACHVATGFDADDLMGRSIWSALMLPDEIALVKRALARVEKDTSVERFETYILTSDGLRRRIAWTATKMTGQTVAQGAAVLATGIDITDRCEAIDRAARAEAMAHDARRLCNELQDRIKLGESQLDGASLARRLPVGVEHDRRARSRRAYPYIQRIAPMRGTAMPDETQFSEWMCHDISSRGFSFLAPSQPDYHKIVVAFGSPPALVYLTAEVRHATRREQNGRTQYIVGCRYTGRVSKKERAKADRGT
jgi:PAS domain S-box-containing protein